MKTYQQGGRLYLDLEDNGGGISRQKITKLFEPLFSTKGSHGTGLGLAVIKYIMERHKGLIHLTVKESYGTRFILSFPLRANFQESEYDTQNMIAYKIEKVDQA